MQSCRWLQQSSAPAYWSRQSFLCRDAIAVSISLAIKSVDHSQIAVSENKNT